MSSVPLAEGAGPSSRTDIPTFTGGITPAEQFWVDHQPWLQECGYMLRPRYRRDWKPSWENSPKPYHAFEDGRPSTHRSILDATRISDGRQVSLKKVSKVIHPHEADIGMLFSSDPLAHEKDNHCVPIYEVLQVPDDDADIIILVMPFLRLFNSPSFETVGEAVDFFQQAFEGLRFMHRHHVAHRDISNLNVMMDPKPMIPGMYHPASIWSTPDLAFTVRPYSRTERPTKYYYIDFGLSRMYNPEDTDPQELPIEGGYKTVPEFQGDEGYKPSNPFRTDIFYLGYLIKECFLEEYTGLDFMNELVAEMIQDDPTKRPTIDTVVERFATIRRKLWWWTLRRRLVIRQYPSVIRGIIHLAYVFRATAYVILLLPSVPKYRPRPDA